jgi:hypothetical protein
MYTGNLRIIGVPGVAFHCLHLHSNARAPGLLQKVIATVSVTSATRRPTIRAVLQMRSEMSDLSLPSLAFALLVMGALVQQPLLQQRHLQLLPELRALSQTALHLPGPAVFMRKKIIRFA